MPIRDNTPELREAAEYLTRELRAKFLDVKLDESTTGGFFLLIGEDNTSVVTLSQHESGFTISADLRGSSSGTQIRKRKDGSFNFQRLAEWAVPAVDRLKVKRDAQHERLSSILRHICGSGVTLAVIANDYHRHFGCGGGKIPCRYLRSEYYAQDLRGESLLLVDMDWNEWDDTALRSPIFSCMISYYEYAAWKVNGKPAHLHVEPRAAIVQRIASLRSALKDPNTGLCTIRNEFIGRYADDMDPEAVAVAILQHDRKIHEEIRNLETRLNEQTSSEAIVQRLTSERSLPEGVTVRPSETSGHVELEARVTTTEQGARAVLESIRKGGENAA